VRLRSVEAVGFQHVFHSSAHSLFQVRLIVCISCRMIIMFSYLELYKSGLVWTQNKRGEYSGPFTVPYRQ
jgi:hypothetical protein